MSLLRELKRRNVYRAAVAYAAVSWLILQIADLVLGNLQAPSWLMQGLILAVAAGFPVALVLSWIYQWTPEGVQRETGETPGSATASATRGSRRTDLVIIGVLAMALVVLGIERVFFAADPAESAAVVDKSIAVLPFVDLSETQDQGWFAAGLAEEILNSLARVPDLLVEARTSSFRYEDSQQDVVSIARELGVAHILEGSVRRTPDRLRVSSQLIRASDGAHLWSSSYDRAPADVIGIQEDIAREIADALETAMDPVTLARMVSTGTTSVPAYETHLRALSIAGPGRLHEVIAAYEEAVEIDPEFFVAHFNLSQLWSMQLEGGVLATDTGLSRDELFERYEEATEYAIEYAVDPAIRLFLKAKKEAYGLNFVRALRLNTQFLEQRPEDGAGRVLQIVLLSRLGMFEEALDAVQSWDQVEEPDGAVIDRSLTLMLWVADTEELRDYAHYAVDVADGSPSLLYQAHRALLWSGDLDAARQILPEIRTSNLREGTRNLAELRQACAERRLEDAEQIYAASIDGSTRDWLWHRVMGEDEHAEELMRPIDEAGDMYHMTGLLIYGHFDPTPFPNLMAFLERQGAPERSVVEIPYRCDRDVRDS